jgi:hypothetical protein
MAGFSPLSNDDLAVNTIRTLAADVVAKANSGHPVSKHRNIPLLNSLAAPPLRMIYAVFSDASILDFRVHLWEWRRQRTFCSQGELSTRHFPDCLSSSVSTNESEPLIRFFNANPKNSKWFNRDRFVLSNG